MRYFVSTNQINDMKPQIELHEATYTRNGIRVNYVLFDDAGEAIVKQTLLEDPIIEWVEENKMNVISLLNTFDLEYNDVELDAKTYMLDNINEVALGYLQYTLERVAA